MLARGTVAGCHRQQLFEHLHRLISVSSFVTNTCISLQQAQPLGVGFLEFIEMLLKTGDVIFRPEDVIYLCENLSLQPTVRGGFGQCVTVHLQCLLLLVCMLVYRRQTKLECDYLILVGRFGDQRLAVADRFVEEPLGELQLKEVLFEVSIARCLVENGRPNGESLGFLAVADVYFTKQLADLDLQLTGRVLTQSCVQVGNGLVKSESLDLQVAFEVEDVGRVR